MLHCMARMAMARRLRSRLRGNQGGRLHQYQYLVTIFKNLVVTAKCGKVRFHG